MKKITGIIAILILLFLAMLFSACKTRKKSTQTSSLTKTSDSANLLKQTNLTVDTGKKTTKTQKSAEASGTKETTVYPTKGKPFTIKNGDTFTGEVDSAKTKQTWHRKSKQVKHEQVNNGLVKLQSKTDSTATHKKKEAKAAAQVIETKTDVMRTVELISVIALILGAVFLFLRFKYRKAKTVVTQVGNILPLFNGSPPPTPKASGGYQPTNDINTPAPQGGSGVPDL